MPLWLIKTAIVIIFVLPISAGVIALMLGDVWIAYLDGKEEGHGQSECDGR